MDLVGRARSWRPGPRLVSLVVGGGAAVLVLYPIAYLIQASLSVGDPQARPPEAYGLDNFTGLGRYAHIFGNTLLVASAATVLAVVVGFAMAWILSRTNVPGRGALEQLMAMPYYVTPLMGALAWALIGSASSGFVNQLWRALGGRSHLIDINTPWGIAWVMALFEGSVAFVMIGAVMKSMDPSLEEASQVLGGGRLRTMLRITLPLVLPGVLGAAVFVFAEMLGSFSAALVLGLPSRFYVVTTAMYQMVSQYPPRFPTAAAMGVSLFAVMFAMVWIYRRIVTAGTYATITGKAFRPRVHGRPRPPLAAPRPLRGVPRRGRVPARADDRLRLVPAADGALAAPRTTSRWPTTRPRCRSTRCSPPSGTASSSASPPRASASS